MARQREPYCSQYDFAEKTLEKVIRFEHNNEINNKKIQEMEEKINHKLDKMEKQIRDILEDKQTFSNEKLKELEDNLNSNKELQQDISRSWTEYKVETSAMLANLKNELKEDQTATPTILFKAKDAPATSLSTGDIIVFPTDVTNEGGGYNNKTGVFTAPVNGVAQFCIYKEKLFYINIIAGGKVISASSFGQDYYNAICYTSDGVTVLEQGETALIKIRGKSSGTNIYPDSSGNYYWTSFSGVLLHH